MSMFIENDHRFFVLNLPMEQTRTEEEMKFFLEKNVFQKLKRDGQEYKIISCESELYPEAVEFVKKIYKTEIEIIDKDDWVIKLAKFNASQGGDPVLDRLRVVYFPEGPAN